MNNAQRHFGANNLEDCYNDEGSIHDEVSDEGPVELEPSSQSSSAKKYGEAPLIQQRHPAHTLEPSLFMPRTQIQKQLTSHSEQSPHKFINSANSSFSNPNQNSSALMKQFSDKIKMQAARLLSLESYKQLCEQTLATLGYDLPISEDSQVPLQSQNQAVELARQLALKEQDVLYANQRAEKAQSEAEQLKKLSDISRGSDGNQDVQSLHQQIVSLEEEKNALLDYIEEKDIGEKSARHGQFDKTLVSKLQREIEDLKIQHEIQISDIQQMMHDQQRQMNLTGEDTFGKDQVLDLQKQLEQTRRACDTAKSEKLDLQLQLDQINNEDRIQQLEQANKELQETLFETQTELEQLIGEHENLQSTYNETKQQLGQAVKIPAQIKQDYNHIQQQYAAVCDDLTKAQAQLQKKCDEVVEQDQKLKEMMSKNQLLQTQIHQLEKQSHDYGVQIQREWETSVENLKGALQQTRGELTEKELVFQRVEKDLKKKLEEVEQSREQKSGLMRRVEDLNSEVLTLKQVKEQKDSKLQQQISRNQELLAQLESINYEMSKTKTDYERTNAMQFTSAQELENTQTKAKKQSKVIDKLCSQMRLASELLDQLIKDCGLNDSLKSHRASSELDYLKQVPEQLNLVALHINTLSNQRKQLQSDLSSAELKIQSIEMKYGDVITEEAIARDKQVFLMTEVDTLKNQLSMIEGEKKQCYQREERIQRTNQQIKTQLDLCRKEQEKILSQMRSQAVKEEKLNQQISEAEGNNQELSYARQELELEKQRLTEQIELILQYMHQIKVAFKSEYLREVFGDIVGQVEFALKLDDAISNTEQELDQKESELRQWAAAENTQLSDQVCYLRQQVEAGRQKLKELKLQHSKAGQDRDRLLSDLRCTEEMERRTTQVALENEISIGRLKEEITKLQNSLDGAARSKEDLRQQNKALSEERNILERELVALREHIKYQAYQNHSRTAPPPMSNLRSPPMHFSQENQNSSNMQNLKPPLPTSGTQNTQSTYNPLSNQSRAKQTSPFKLPTDAPSLSTQRSQSSKNLYMPQPIVTHRSYQESRDENDTNSNQNHQLVEHSRSSSVHQKISQLQNVFSQMRRNLNE